MADDDDADLRLMQDVRAEDQDSTGGGDEEESKRRHSGSESAGDASESGEDGENVDGDGVGTKKPADVQAALEAAKAAAGLSETKQGPDKEGELVAEDADDAERQAQRAAAKLALKKKAQMEAAMRENVAQLFEAAKAGDADNVQLALDGGVHPDTIGGVSPTVDPKHVGYRALHFAAAGADESHVACIDLLLGAGADVNAATHSGWSALHFAAFWGRAAAAQRLLEWGASASQADGTGRTAHAKAVFRRHTGVVQLLEMWGGGPPPEETRKIRNFDSHGNWTVE